MHYHCSTQAEGWGELASWAQSLLNAAEGRSTKRDVYVSECWLTPHCLFLFFCLVVAEYLPLFVFTTLINLQNSFIKRSNVSFDLLSAYFYSVYKLFIVLMLHAAFTPWEWPADGDSVKLEHCRFSHLAVTHSLWHGNAAFVLLTTGWVYTHILNKTASINICYGLAFRHKLC